MQGRRAMVLLFMMTTVACGLVFWWQADWWAYVQDPLHGPWPKFKAPAWEQFVVSSVVGACFGGVVVGTGLLLRLGVSRLKQN